MKLLKKITIIQWLLIVTFLNGLIFAMVVPIWHAPDEQAHFAQVQNIAETGRTHAENINNLSEEILISERLLGTERNKFGKNEFTHKPWYRIEYTNSILGRHEAYLASLDSSTRTNLVKREATLYPPLFYFISATFYRFAYSGDLISRVMITRLASVLMGTAMVFFSFKISQLVFPKNKLAALTAAVLVSFQPMFSFLIAGVNSDNMMNVLFTAFIYLAARTIAAGKFAPKDALLLLLLILALKYTKPHGIIAIPITIVLSLFFIKQIKKIFSKQKIAILFSLSALVVGFTTGIIPFPSPEIDLIPSLIKPNFNISFLSHLQWTARHTYAEVVPWYWGVFNWLGVTLPRVVNRIINRILILGAAGLIIWIVKVVRRKKVSPSEKVVIFLTGVSAIYFASLTFWDWLFRRHHNFSFGMQGRYYFPTLSAHMILLLVGLMTLVGILAKKWHAVFLKVVGIAAVVLNFIGLRTLAVSYYQLSPINTLLNQVSQYKPVYFKFPWVIIWFGVYAITLFGFIIKYIKYASRSRSRSKASN